MEIRREILMLKAISGIIAAGLSIYLAWFEFGFALFKNTIFWAFIILGAWFAFLIFLAQWEQTKKKSEAEFMVDEFEKLKKSIDGLIIEIRHDRNERKSR